MPLRIILRTSALALFAALAVSCSARSDASTPSYRGTITSGCAPHDAPSTVIRLVSDESDAVVSFNLWPSSGTIPPATVAFDSRRPDGQGDYCTGPEACQAAVWGEVELAASAADGQVTGEWTLGLEDGSVQSGTFNAEWLTIQALCG